MNKKLITFCTAILSCASLAKGLEITPTYIDGEGCVWDSAKRLIVEQAITDWESLLLDNESLDITFQFSDAGPTYLAQWSGAIQAYEGADIYPWSDEVTHEINLNIHFADDWYFDPTPLTDDVPFPDFDVLSIMRHQLCHTLGFTSNFYFDNIFAPDKVDKWSTHVVGSVFDPGGLDVSLASALNISHVIDAGITEDDLMTPTIINGQRKSISQTDLDMLELAYGYTLGTIPIPGDYNSDGYVDQADFTTWADSYGDTGPDLPADGNSDGIIDQADFTTWADHYGDGTPQPAPPAAIPEPATLMLIGIGSVLIARRKYV